MASEPLQEVRFAIVLYGGVSLAVYINGVVQELLRLVRSTAGLESPNGSEIVYRKLGQVLGPGELPDKQPGADDSIKAKFKIDIISGTSAGGINCIFLATALASEGGLKQLEELWFDEGGIEGLLNDSASYKGLSIAPQSVPQSLLNSRRMYVKLLNALDEMDRTAPRGKEPSSRLADEVDLFATTTDIEGVPVPIRLLDNVVFERRFRNAFHLRFRAKERNDFQPDNNRFLAFAARCTSSFPFAFEPMRLCDIDEALSAHCDYARRADCFSSSARWQKFYANYLDDVCHSTTPFPQRSFGDGRYLNNAPFSYAVDTLLTRHADLPVVRKLLYVEPSPAHPEEQTRRADKPNALQNSLAALITIPGYQTIRNDLSRVLQRNRAASRINTTLGEIQSRVQRAEAQGARVSTSPESVEITFHEDPKDMSYQAYYQLFY